MASQLNFPLSVTALISGKCGGKVALNYIKDKNHLGDCSFPCLWELVIVS